MKLDLIAIVGPTATGKTRLGVEVAHRLSSEIVSADSRQVYRGLDIGTGKDLDEYTTVSPPIPYHLIDIADPEEVYSLFRYQQDCFRVLRELAARAPFANGETPVVLVGGSGLYVESVIREFRLADVPENPQLRERLRARDRDELAAELKKRCPDLAVESDVSSKRRIIRALEIAEYRETRPVCYGEPPGLPLQFQVFGIDVPREELRRRIGLRLRERLEGGMVEEVQELLDRGIDPARLDDLGLEYREITAYLLGKKTRQQMVSDLEIAIGRFAKRQQTWFRGMERRGVPIRWIGPEDPDLILTAVGNRR
jgi:tRNA dimethylallyltransferase